MPRHYSATDQLFARLSDSLGMLARKPAPAHNPAQYSAEVPADEAARQHSAGLMRINHAGEVAAQALYHGQALTARIVTSCAQAGAVSPPSGPALAQPGRTAKGPPERAAVSQGYPAVQS